MYLYKSEGKRKLYSPAMKLDSDSLKQIQNPVRLKVLKLLAKKPMYPVEIAKELGIHEQNVYYHIRPLIDSGILEVCGKKEIRGTVAKKLRPRFLSYAFSLDKDWKALEKVSEDESKLMNFVSPFIREGILDASFVVGNPDPHGPHKARARDGHYAIDLALFFGRYCVTEGFATRLDVDVDLNQNLLVVGGPVTNLVFSKINENLPVRFSESKPWGIISKIKTYSEDTTGMIARIVNPVNKDKMILIFAGIRNIGTKAAVMGFTNFTDDVLHRFTGQKSFYSIVQGYDRSGDGKIDSIDLLE